MSLFKKKYVLSNSKMNCYKNKAKEILYICYKRIGDISNTISSRYHAYVICFLS